MRRLCGIQVRGSFKCLLHFEWPHHKQFHTVCVDWRHCSEGYEAFQRDLNVFVNKEHASLAFFSSLCSCIPVPTSRNRCHVFFIKYWARANHLMTAQKDSALLPWPKRWETVHCQLDCQSFNHTQYLTLNLLLAIAVWENENTQITSYC